MKNKNKSLDLGGRKKFLLCKYTTKEEKTELVIGLDYVSIQYN